jgi:hypothetical protein
MRIRILPLIAAVVAAAACGGYDHGERGNPSGGAEKSLSITLRNDGGGSVQADKHINTTNRDLVVSGYKAGDVVSLTAVANPIGTVFGVWTAVGNVEFENAAATTTSFVMPDDNVIIKANYVGTTDNVIGLAADVNTRAALEANLAAWDGNGDGKLSIAEAAAVKELDLSGKGLSNGTWAQLDGVIGYFTGLESFNISNNPYIIGFDVSKCPNLKVLTADGISPNYSASYAATPTIDLQYNGKLERVSINSTTNQGTRLSGLILPVSKTLKSLSIASTFNPNTYLQRLNLTTLTGLEELRLEGMCYINQIDFPATETLKTVTIIPGQWGSNNSNLRYVDIGKLTGLETFTLEGCSLLATVVFPESSALKTVNISSSKSYNSAMTALDMTGLTGLEVLQMAQYGALADVGFPATPTLKTIDMKMTLNMNRTMTLLDVSMLTGLELLDMSGNWNNYNATSTAGHIRARRAVEPNVGTIIRLPAGAESNPEIMVYVD